jgi:hypothetical protein
LASGRDPGPGPVKSGPTPIMITADDVIEIGSELIRQRAAVNGGWGQSARLPMLTRDLSLIIN